jgi:hypothetical protein
MFTEPLPSNALIESVTILNYPIIKCGEAETLGGKQEQQ